MRRIAPDAEIVEHDMRRTSAYERAQALGVRRVPAVAVEGLIVVGDEDE